MKVSILVAARNEEVTIGACLKSLISQNVNNNVCVDILIGNDDSVDKTAEIVQRLVLENSNVKLYNIPPHKTLRGKVNVLEYLRNQTNSEYLLFADADVIYPESWVQSMLKALNQVDIVTGVTIPEGKSLWNNYQRLDWMLALNMLHLLSKLNIPVTAMGNNMGLKSKILHEIGGFKSIPFSVVEDFALFKEVINKGGKFEQLYSSKVLAETLPVNSLEEWLFQRWRWMQGVKNVPIPLKVMHFLNIIFYPLLIFLGFFFNDLLWFASGVYLIKCFYLIKIQRQLNLTIAWVSTLLFDPIFMVTYARLLLYSLKKPDIVWKGRHYKSE